jgi:hypothetical protein
MNILNNIMTVIGYSVVLFLIIVIVSAEVQIMLIQQFHKRKGLYKVRRKNGC